MRPRCWLVALDVADARTAVARVAAIGRGYTTVRLRHHVEEVCTGDVVFFWVRGDDIEGLYAVGRVFSMPEWTVVRGDPGEDEFLCAQVARLRYSKIADHVVLERADLENDPAFDAFELFAAPDVGNVHRVSPDQWRVLISALKPLTPDPGWSRPRPPAGPSPRTSPET